MCFSYLLPDLSANLLKTEAYHQFRAERQAMTMTPQDSAKIQDLFETKHKPRSSLKSMNEKLYQQRHAKTRQCQVLERLKTEFKEFYVDKLKDVEEFDREQIEIQRRLERRKRTRSADAGLYELSSGRKYSPQDVIAVLKAHLENRPISELNISNGDYILQDIHAEAEAFFQPSLEDLATSMSGSVKVDAHNVFEVADKVIEQKKALTPEEKDLQQKALQVLKKEVMPKLFYRRLKKAIPEAQMSNEARSFVDSFESRSRSLAQSFPVNTKPGFIDFDNKLEPGYIYEASGRSPLSNQEHIVVNKGIDPQLARNFKQFDDKWKQTEKAYNSAWSTSLKRLLGYNIRTEKDSLFWKSLMAHVDTSFALPAKYADSIADNIRMTHLLGDNIETGAGICRHKALLAKHHADELGYGHDMALIGGELERGNGHAWNFVRMDGRLYLFDAHNALFEPWTEELSKTFIFDKSAIKTLPSFST